MNIIVLFKVLILLCLLYQVEVTNMIVCLTVMNQIFGERSVQNPCCLTPNIHSTSLLSPCTSSSTAEKQQSRRPTATAVTVFSGRMEKLAIYLKFGESISSKTGRNQQKLSNTVKYVAKKNKIIKKINVCMRDVLGASVFILKTDPGHLRRCG